MSNNLYMSKECHDIMNGVEQKEVDTTALRSLPNKQMGDESTITPEIQAKFEAAFGIDQNSRTPAQWRNLVKTYGLDTVVQQEGMTQEQVTNRCAESFSTSLRRSLKKTRH